MVNYHMRRIVVWLASTVTVVVLMFGYHTSVNSPSASPPGSTVATAPAPSSSGAPSASSSSSGAKTYTGSVAQTRWGPVQVEITIVAGKVTKVAVVQYPNGNQKDQQINDYALPVLVQETIDAQSANIDMVSGGTVTSTGYVQSLQSALDQA